MTELVGFCRFTTQVVVGRGDEGSVGERRFGDIAANVVFVADIACVAAVDGAVEVLGDAGPFDRRLAEVGEEKVSGTVVGSFGIGWSNCQMLCFEKFN